MKHLSIILMILVVLVNAGCDSTDIVTLPTQEPKLVVSSLGYAGYPWRARVSVSQDVLDLETFQSIKDATVNIYENGVLAEQLPPSPYFDPDGKGSLYMGSATVPKPGNIYKITVAAPGYTMIESEYRQPDSVQVQTFSVTELGADPRYPRSTRLSLKVGFTDPPGETFYEILGEAYYNDPEFNFGSTAGLSLQFIDPAYRENNNVFYQTLAFDDTFFDGKTVEFEFDGVGDGEYDYRNYSIYLRVLSKEYFQYLKTTNLQRNAQSDPFAQPVLISNNIVNGYGVFGGYTESKKSIVLDK